MEYRFQPPGPLQVVHCERVVERTLCASQLMSAPIAGASVVLLVTRAQTGPVVHISIPTLWTLHSSAGASQSMYLLINCFTGCCNKVNLLVFGACLKL